MNNEDIKRQTNIGQVNTVRQQEQIQGREMEAKTNKNTCVCRHGNRDAKRDNSVMHVTVDRVCKLSNYILDCEDLYL